MIPRLNVSSYRNRRKPCAQHFKKENDICYCNDISAALFYQLGEPYDPNEWRLFVDGTKESLKAVLLHIGNKKNHLISTDCNNKSTDYEAIITDLLQNYKKMGTE